MMISVIVCTYNREEILKDCLNSLIKQTAGFGQFEVIVVDNNSNDSTKKVIDYYVNSAANFKYVLEERQGLSFARNRGAEEARYNWLLYLDDDGLAENTMVERALYVIKNYDFDCFGGTYTAWFKFGKPRWMPESFGTKELLLEKIGEINSSSLDGGLFAINKKPLQKAGGFNIDLGMKGKSIAYGEETALQHKLLIMHYKLGFDPELRMKHLVGKHKLKIRWHIKAEFARGRDSVKAMSVNSMKWTIWLQVKVVLSLFFIGVYKNATNLKNSNYFIENLILDIFKPIAFRYGQQSNSL